MRCPNRGRFPNLVPAPSESPRPISETDFPATSPQQWLACDLLSEVEADATGRDRCAEVTGMSNAGPGAAWRSHRGARSGSLFTELCGGWLVAGSVAWLFGSIRIFACRSGLPSASNALSTPCRPTVPVMSGSTSTFPSASMWSVSRNSSGVYPTAKRSSICLLTASAGRSLSAPMHTPTTTTRESSGAPAMIWSIMPGRPTHSKITGRLGAAPSFSAILHTWCQGSGTRLSFSMVSSDSSTAAGSVWR